MTRTTGDKFEEMLENAKGEYAFQFPHVEKLIDLLLMAEERLKLFVELDVVNEGVPKADMDRAREALAAIEAFRRSK